MASGGAEMEMEMAAFESPTAWYKGPFLGHLLPGLGLLLWSCAWVRAWLQQPHRGPRLLASAGLTASTAGVGTRASFSSAEQACRGVVSLAGIVSEMASARLNTGGRMRWLFFQPPVSNLQNFSHATMHLGLLLALICELAERRWPRIVPPMAIFALALALGAIAVLLAVHASLQPAPEAAAHVPLALAFGMAAAATAGDGAWRRAGWLGARSFALALAGTWMCRMALARDHHWDEAFRAPMAAQTVAALHFSWIAMALASLWALLACAARSAALRGKAPSPEARV